MQSFSDLGVSRAVVQALARDAITEPFAVQRLVIADVLAGRDLLVRSPTGSGKTLAFGVPLVDRLASDGPRPAGLILAPTRELASQIADDLRPVAHARALRVATVYGGVGLIAQAKRAANAHILVATPGRLEDLLAREAFGLDAIQMLVLDEADRMLDMGFAPAVERIVGACPRSRQTLFFSATLDGEAGRLARRYTVDPVSRETGPPTHRAAAEIEHRFVTVGPGADRLRGLVDELSARRDLALVFVRTKRGADRLVKRLGSHGVGAVALHGDKTQGQRERALAAFATGATDVLVATDVAARGIDVSGISHVINFDPPHDRDSYVHRVGRTGRAGRTGVAITLLDAGQRAETARLADELGLASVHEPGRRRPHAGQAPPAHRPARPDGRRPRRSRRHRSREGSSA
ncbi:MAG: DEAD/DEAH box helicase [Solirubrobacterales bacterium]|nr:DEAD/DEAH box helicase [Solirubrobacterales bacterium]